MKILKKILLGIMALVALLLIIALFVKKDYKVEREIIINKPTQQVFNYVKYLKNQDNYSKWANIDPDMKKAYQGVDGTVGFVSAWKSDNDEVGEGEQEIKGITEGKRIDFELRFFKPFEATEPAFMTTEPVSESQTKVTWGFSGHMDYPTNLMLIFMDFEKMIGSDLQIGLKKLKEVLKTQAVAAEGSKEFLLQYFNQTTDNLKKAVEGLSKAQLQFKPTQNKWSISQCLEHIVASEKMLFGMAKKEMQKPAQPDMKRQVKFSDAELIGMITDRSKKHQAPKELQGMGKYSNPQTAVDDLMAARQPVLAYIQNVDLENLRNHVSDYPTGKADGYQSILFIAAHSVRHTKQIEEAKSNSDFPTK